MKRLIVLVNWFICRFYEIYGKATASYQNVNATRIAMTKDRHKINDHDANGSTRLTSATYAVKH